MSSMFLIGHGISHSLSPAMWNRLFEATGRPLRYGLRDVDVEGLGEVEAEVRSGDVVAANVTMPHKAWAAGVADAPDPTVRATGVSNLLLPSASGLRALNTDIVGARNLLATRAPYGRVLILGAGGTAVALLEALVGLTQDVVLTNRTPDRADRLARRYDRRFEQVAVVPWGERAAPAASVDLVVNTVPSVDLPVLDMDRLHPDAALYDVIYRHRPTAMQSQAAHRGIPRADGLAHLAAQAIAMLEPLDIEADAAPFLVEGLERATGREVRCWGARIV